jgi:hypothetical protein
VKTLKLADQKRHFIGYRLATISGKIRMFECVNFDGKTTQPDWNSLKNGRIALCLCGVRRIPLSPPSFEIAAKHAGSVSLLLFLSGSCY